MRISSFDVFDTVLTRAVARPTDIFLIVASHLHRARLIDFPPVDFKTRRIGAEKRIRPTSPGHEPTLVEIYTELAQTLLWTTEQAREAMDFELEAESRNLCAVPPMRATVESARRRGDQVVFVSDMYLPADFVEGILRREACFQDGDRLYVSNTHRSSKARGTIFALIRGDFPTLESWHHTGDSPHSDREMPQRAGIEATLWTTAHLTPREKRICGSHTTSLSYSRLAAANRLVRLQNPEVDEPRKTIRDIGASVAGPLLFAYVAWVLDEAGKRGIKRLYFVARDGEILLKVAQILCPAWNLEIDCRYLYGSRQAWHSPSITRLGDHERKWLLEADIPLTGEVIADRLGFRAEDRTFLLAALSAIASPSVPLLPTQMEAAWDVLRSDSVAERIARSTSEDRSLLLDYLRQENFLEPDIPKALVDLGWRGNMQRSLRQFLDTTGHSASVTGFYFGFSEPPPDLAHYLSFWEHLHHTLFPKNRVTMMEIFTAGREGSAIGYERRGDKIVARLKRTENREALDWGLHTFQQAVCEYARLVGSLIPLEDAVSPGFQLAASELFLELCDHPTPAEATAMGAFPYTRDQFDSIFEQLVDPKLSFQEFARLAWNKNLWHRHPWIEGQLAIQPCWPVRLAQSLRRSKQRFFPTAT